MPITDTAGLRGAARPVIGAEARIARKAAWWACSGSTRVSTLSKSQP